MKAFFIITLCCLWVSNSLAQEEKSIRVVAENGKYGAVNEDLILPMPPKKKKKTEDEPLTRPWIVPPIYDSLVLLSTATYYPSYNRSYKLSLFVAWKGAYLTSFYENAEMLYTESRRREIIPPVFTENSKAVSYRFVPISDKIKVQPIALLGENRKWAVGSWDHRYFSDNFYQYDSVDFEPVTNDVRADENTKKGTWVVFKNGIKFYVDKNGREFEWIGDAKNEKYMVRGFSSGNYDVAYLFSKAGKYGIMTNKVILPAQYDSIEGPEQLKEGHSGIVFAKLNGLYNLFDLRSEKQINIPIQVTGVKSFYRDVFLKSPEGKWYIFDGVKLSYDSTAYDYLFDNVPDRILLMNSASSMSYLGEKNGNMIKGKGPGVAMPSPNEVYSYVLSNGLIHFTDKKTSLQGLKHSNGQVFVPPVFKRLVPSFYTKPEVFNNPNSKPVEWLYEFTWEAGTMIGSVDPETYAITGHILCGKCDGDGHIYLETREVVKGETKTYTTSPVQTLRSEAFDVKTGTWTKTYSNISEQVTKLAQDKVVQQVQKVKCESCQGKGRTPYLGKWDGKKYSMAKLPN